MNRVALIVHAFPSREHPYIVEWARGLVRVGVDLIIYAEQVTAESLADSALARRVHELNSLRSPLRSIRRNFFVSVRNLTHLPRAWRILGAAHPKKTLTVLRKLYEYLPLLDEHFDVAHFNAPQIAFRRFELGDLLAAKTLVSFRGQDISFDPPKYDDLLRDADHLHFISNHLVELAKGRGYSGDKHTLIYPMVDMVFYQPAVGKNFLSLKPPFILFTAARFEWVKGWEFALRAVALLIERGYDLHYYIAGDGELRDLVLFTVEQLGIRERVHLLGWQSPTQVRDWMQRADVYLLASVEEAFNNSVLQAQACGLPVVCSDAGGLSENIANGETGLLFHRRDAWDMAEKVETVLSDAELRLDMRRLACERVEKNFLLQAGVYKFVSLYRELER